VKTTNKTVLTLVLISTVGLSIIGRFWAGGWFLLLFWWVLIIPPIWHSLIHLKYLWKIKEIKKNHLKVLYISHVTLLLLFLFQPDAGDGNYHMTSTLLIDSLFDGFNSYVNNKIDFEFWFLLQFINLLIFVVVEVVTTIKIRKYLIENQ
tara:strand:- start:288 stop:734 length:447 start_codon:yes stop_codon:yes gene_type:complete